MRRFWAKFYLWLNGYCTKHGIEKRHECSLADVYVFCEECEAERAERTDHRIEDALKVLGHTPD